MKHSRLKNILEKMLNEDGESAIPNTTAEVPADETTLPIPLLGVDRRELLKKKQKTKDKKNNDKD